MNIAIGCDHRGVHLKDRITKHLQDAATRSPIVVPIRNRVATIPTTQKKVVRTGQQWIVRAWHSRVRHRVGMAIAANKIKGVRAANAHDDVTAELSRRHNDAISFVCR